MRFRAARLPSWLRRERAGLALLVAMLVLRVVVVWHATWIPVSDSRDYHALAQSLMRGEGYRQVYDGETASFRGLTLYAYRMPGYPMFLAGLYSLFGLNPRVAYLANVFCDLVTAVGMLWLGRVLFGRTSALLATSLFAIHVLWTANLMSETLFTALFTILGLLLATGMQAPTPRRALGYGILQMFAVFVRPIGIVALPVALYRILRVPDRTRAVVLAALITGPTLVSAGLWSFRNWRLLGTFTLSTNFGAHNARSFGVVVNRIVLDVRSQGGNEATIDRALTQAIQRSVVRRPRAAWSVYSHRVVDVLRLRPDWVVDAVLLKHTFRGKNGAPWVQRLYVALHRADPATYGLACAGGLILLAQRRTLRGLWALFAAYVVLHAAVSFSDIRFAAPLYPLMCLAAGSGLATVGTWGWAQLRRSGIRVSAPATKKS